MAKRQPDTFQDAVFDGRKLQRAIIIAGGFALASSLAMTASALFRSCLASLSVV
ncbi:MAG: hypothetical protein AAFX03_11200 [Pseudomonadota bacterium]